MSACAAVPTSPSHNVPLSAFIRTLKAEMQHAEACRQACGEPGVFAWIEPMDLQLDFAVERSAKGQFGGGVGDISIKVDSTGKETQKNTVKMVLHPVVQYEELQVTLNDGTVLTYEDALTVLFQDKTGRTVYVAGTLGGRFGQQFIPLSDLKSTAATVPKQAGPTKEECGCPD